MEPLAVFMPDLFSSEVCLPAAPNGTFPLTQLGGAKHDDVKHWAYSGPTYGLQLFSSPSYTSVPSLGLGATVVARQAANSPAR